jgi:(1->4)-alpha-D-glucan 1-alpha-D-glucosylmutase
MRAGIRVLSETPDEWSREVSRWMRLNRSHRTIVDGDPAPDRNDEYRFYQTLVGVWPAELNGAMTAGDDLVRRLQEYMLKAAREAKVHTSWLTENQPYENALTRFVERALGAQTGARFFAALLPFRQRVARLGVVNSLAQVALKLMSPGVPDLYQGTDLWDFNLVDPDNRRPVDFDRRTELLGDVDCVLRREPAARGGAINQMLADWTDGRIKLLVTAAGLRLRRDMPALFPAGDYVPLATEVTVRAGAVAFARTSGGDAVVVAAPRLASSLCDDDHPLPLGGDCWRTSRLMLPDPLRHRTFRHVLTGAEIRPTIAGETAWIFLGEIFQAIPVGILRAE